MRKHNYLTAEIAKSLKPGDKLKLGYDDFNRAKFTFTMHGTKQEDCLLQGRLPGFHIFGLAEFDDGGESFVMEFYEFHGPHRSEGMAPIMCSGSGAERVYIIKRKVK